MKRAVVFGRANGVWSELAEAQKLCEFDYVVGVGSAGVNYPGFMHAWVSFHDDLFPLWVEKRQEKGYPPAESYWSYLPKPSVVVKRHKLPVPVQRIKGEGGSSGLIATLTALEGLKADLVVLAGIPMHPDHGQYDDDGAKPWREAVKHRKAWETAMPRLLGRVKSMSGWTQQVLGAPTKEWLEGHHVDAAV